MTASALYEGAIRHRRHAGPRREFTHALTLAYVDLDELPTLLDGLLVRPFPGIVRFRRADYLGDAAVPLREAVLATVREATGRAPDGPVRVLTALRWLGHCFNPISLYYCFDGDDELDAVVAEVTNTPWGERHAYVLGATGSAPKALHVSPFMGMAQRYEVRAPAPRRTLSVHIASREGADTVFDATLGMRRLPLTRRMLAASGARRPLPTLRMLALIYGHAAALLLRGARVYPHPAAPATDRARR